MELLTTDGRIIEFIWLVIMYQKSEPFPLHSPLKRVLGVL